MFALTKAISDRITHNRRNDQSYSAKQHQRISMRRQHITADRSYNQRQPDPDRKGYCQPRNFNCGYEEKVGYVK
jgi:hypothetical protein